MKQLLLLATLLFTPFFLLAQKEVTPLIEEGVKLHDAEKYKEAVEQFEAALKIEPKNITANYEMANTLIALEDYKKAIKFADKVIDLKPKSATYAQAFMLKATALDMLEKPKEAIKIYREGIKIAPDMQLMYFNLGVTLVKIKEYKEAEEALIAAIKLKPSHPSSHFVLGQIHFAQNHVTKALMAYYNFLLLDQKSERAQSVGQRIYAQLETKKNNTGGLNISLSLDGEDPSFGASDLLIAMMSTMSAVKKVVKDSANLDSITLNKNIKNLEKADTVLTAARFAERNVDIFKYFEETIGKAKDTEKNFWWRYYGDFYAELNKAGHTEVFSYYISTPRKDKEVSKWLAENKDKINAFAAWIKAYNFNTK